MHKVIAEDGRHRQHRQWLRNLLETTKGPVRFASPYITHTDLLLGIKSRKVQLLTSLLRMDVVSGATSLESLRLLINAGVQCRCLSDGPRLHAKVYMFGDQCAVVTSANLTTSALNSNIEVGVQLTGSAVEELTAWFDTFWAKAQPLAVTELAKWQQQTDALRHEHTLLRKKAGALPTLPNEASPFGESPEELRELLDNANQFFLCNTDRRYSARTSSGGYEVEEKMHSRHYAAAWESFRYPTHMDKVKRGDAIFMFAKGVGIVGIGCAQGKCQILEPGDPDRILNFSDEEDKPEWRVPVVWLVWRDDKDACVRRGPNGTFFNVTQDTELQAVVRKHFLGGS